MPESYGFSGFRREHLPILPQEFRLVPRQVREDKVYKDDPRVVRQLEVLRELFDRCKSIIVATDGSTRGGSDRIIIFVVVSSATRVPCSNL